MASNKDYIRPSKNIATMQDGKHKKILILLESAEQVKDYLSRLDGIYGEKRIIALTPFAMYELERYGVDYKIPEDYYDPDELYKMGISNYDKVENLCNIIDRIIKQYSQDTVKYNVTTAMFTIRHINTIYNVLMTRMFQLSKLIGAEKPDSVFVYETNIYQFGDCKSAPYLFYDNRESIYSRLLLLDGWNTSINILCLTRMKNEGGSDNKSCVNKDKKISVKTKNIIASWLRMHPHMYDLALTMQKNGAQGLSNFIVNKFGSEKKIPVILYGSGYNWDDSIDELLKNGIGPIYRISDDFVWLKNSKTSDFGDLDAAWLEVKDNVAFREFFLFKGIDFFSVVVDRFEYLVKQLTTISIKVMQHTVKLITKHNIESVIASTLATCIGNSVACAAHNCALPVITWQHGGYGAMENHPLVEYLDLMNSDVHFVFGDGVIESHLQSAKKYGTKLVSVGSSSIEHMIKDNSKHDLYPNKKKVILYVTDLYLKNGQYIATPPPQSDVLYWKTQHSILKLLEKHQEYSIIVKLHPSEVVATCPIKLYIQDRGLSNFQLVGNEKTFSDIIPLADIIIIDRPFTTILQALTTKKPIFLFTGHVHYNKHAEKLVSKRAVCSRELDDFLNKLEIYLIDNEYHPNVDCDEFLEMYAIASQIDYAGDMAAKELIKTIHEFKHM